MVRTCPSHCTLLLVISLCYDAVNCKNPIRNKWFWMVNLEGRDQAYFKTQYQHLFYRTNKTQEPSVRTNSEWVHPKYEDLATTLLTISITIHIPSLFSDFKVKFLHKTCHISVLKYAHCNKHILVKGTSHAAANVKLTYFSNYHVFKVGDQNAQ